MTSHHTKYLLSLVALGLIPMPLFAQAQSYYYGGISVGQSRSSLDEENITQQQIGSGLSVVNIQREERDTAYKLFGGYQFNRYYGMEVGYFYLGTPHFSSTTTPDGSLEGKVKIQGWNVDLLGFLPLTTNLSALGRLGAQYAKTSDRFTGSGAVVPADPNPTNHHGNYKFGAGLQYEFSPSFLLRGEWERYRVSDAMSNHAAVNVASLSLIFPFGRAARAMPVAATEAPYVPPEPAPAPPPPAPVVEVAPPPVVAVTPPPARRRVTFSAESLYTFDQSQIRPEGKAALDTFAQELVNTQYEMIVVEGHTDRLGSPAYNQRLSERRAEAVKAYLIETGKVDPNKVTATGKGESTPVTRPEDCRGTKRTAKLIACLQPDRRVEIEVTGTR
ncbi:OmpA family protein [Aquabacterium sp.]|uniref:OmpA family protein n=1 Tax=Aquabacterium sp. TaxID=1872578 RepID=UPI002E327705|nr:OmpA family protein [Aquabacterium sp.]HEX5311968.1 OmpA family protein [Aquabacterium sp.]